MFPLASGLFIINCNSRWIMTKSNHFSLRRGFTSDYSKLLTWIRLDQVKNLESSETSESLEYFLRLFLFRLFDFDLIIKIENSEKKSELTVLSEISKFSICHFLEFLIKYPRFKFQFR